jgi:hypothetical protein
LMQPSFSGLFVTCSNKHTVREGQACVRTVAAAKVPITAIHNNRHAAITPQQH